MTIKNYSNSLPPPYAPITTAYNASVVNSDGDKHQTEQEITYIPWEANTQPAELLEEAQVVIIPIADPVKIGPPQANIHTNSDACSYVPIKPSPVAYNITSNNPPGNCRDGGQWGTLQYIGNKTGAMTCIGFLICGMFGLLILACPQDEKDAYRVDGKVYDASGIYIGRAGDNSKSFIPTVKRGKNRTE